MQRPGKTGIRNAILLAAAMLFLTAPAVSQESNDPWGTLENVRTSMLKAGPVSATFSTTDVPEGSSKGETESGRVAIALPGCIRWDYQQPSQKSFLVCDGMAYYWNNEDGNGSRNPIDYAQEPALSFFLVDLDFLKKYYSASGRPVSRGLEILLILKGAADLDQGAVITVDPKSKRIVEVSYRMGGNLTRFVIGQFGPLGNRNLFSPPQGIRWTDGN